MPKTNLHILKHEDRGGTDTLTPVGIPGDKLRVPVGKQVLNYFNNIRKAVFSPKNILAPQKISGAGGKIEYTLSEDVRKIRGEAYDAGLRAGQRMTEKLERYVEGEKAIEIYERGKTYGYNNGFAEGADAGAKEIEKRFGGFEELENTAYNPKNTVALLGSRFVVVNEWDDEFSLYERRYGKDKLKAKLLETVDQIVDGNANPCLGASPEKSAFIEKGTVK